ncbi:Large exoprotein [Catenovulum agarivorans DS-2]|uniref:Large exoprotein n=1 Tax=Catenovulum agarivorans DS-2 TaxID=1328313 RepID=W7QIT1_9ALTE|nr:VCBS domain-containing protein [Catenovulum agarivorans]EWH08852.1 Large exoprotein [Catenovulum agarivorans DS-2]
MKYKLLTLSIVAALTGCGSDDQRPIGFKANTATVPTFTGEFAAVATKHAETGNPSGQIIISDETKNESQFYPFKATGTYGEFSFSASGEWSYTLWQGHEYSATPEHPAVTALVKAGLPDLFDSFTVKTADGTEKQFTVTIRGIDEPATFGGDIATRLVQRDTDQGNAEGTITVNDANPAEAYFKPILEQPNTVATEMADTAKIVTSYGEVMIKVLAPVEATETDKAEPGKVEWTYDLDEMNQEVIALADASESLNDTFTLVSADGTEQEVTVLVKGSDPVPATFVANSPLTTNEDGTFSTVLSVNDANLAGSLSITDPNYQEAAFKPLTDAETTYGRVSIDASGNFAYNIDYTNDDVKSILLDTAQDPLPTLNESLTFEAIDGTLANVTVSLEAALLEPAVISGLPAVEDGVSTSAVNANLLATAGNLNLTDANTWQASFIADSFATTYGSFSINEAGSWSYTLSDESVGLINDGTLVLPFTEQIRVSAKDGTEVNLPISITSVEGLNFGAQIAGTGSGTKVWVMKMPDGTGAVGKAEFTLRVPESNTKDVKVQFHGSEWQGGDVRKHMLSMALQPRSNSIFILDGTGTSTTGNSVKLDQPLTMGELLKFEFSWDGSVDTLAANGDKPLITLKLNGKPVSGSESASGSSIVDGVFPSFSTVDVSKLDKGPRFFAIWTKDALPVDLDDLIIYSDLAGTTEIFSERFDEDGIAEGVEITRDYVHGGLTKSNTVGVEFPPADKFLRLSNNEEHFGGTTLEFAKQEKGSVSFDVRMNTSAHSGYTSLFGGTSGGQGDALVDFDLNKFGAFKVRGTTQKPGYIPVIRYPMGEWFPIELSWDATGDSTPTVTMKLNGSLVTEIPDFTLDADGAFESKSTAPNDIAEGVHRIAFKCGYNVNADKPSVCDFDNVVVKAADGSTIATEDFNSLDAGEDVIVKDDVLQSGMKTLGTIRNADIVEK